jgi:hypothetical protein
MDLIPGPDDRKPLILVAPNVRTAHLWCRDNDISPYDRRAVKIVTTADSLRGLGRDRDITVINPAGAVWHWRVWQRVSDYLGVVTSAYKPASYNEVWL